MSDTPPRVASPGADSPAGAGGQTLGAEPTRPTRRSLPHTSENQGAWGNEGVSQRHRGVGPSTGMGGEKNDHGSAGDRSAPERACPRQEPMQALVGRVTFGVNCGRRRILPATIEPSLARRAKIFENIGVRSSTSRETRSMAFSRRRWRRYHSSRCSVAARRVTSSSI